MAVNRVGWSPGEFDDSRDDFQGARPDLDDRTLRIDRHQWFAVGDGRVVREGDPATLYLTSTEREALNGDKLLSIDTDVPLHRPDDHPVDVDRDLLSLLDHPLDLVFHLTSQVLELRLEPRDQVPGAVEANWRIALSGPRPDTIMRTWNRSSARSFRSTS